MYFTLAVARRLKERYSGKLHLYCFGPQEMATYRGHNDDGLFDSISDANVLLARCFDAGLDYNAVMENARAFEDTTGVTINQLLVPDRHFGRGYALGGFYHPRSRYSEQTTYLQAVHACSETLAFWQREFRDKGITLCLNGPREAYQMARAASIPYRVLAASRYRNYHYWAHNDFYENPEFERRWASAKEDETLTLDQPYHTHLASRAVHLKRFSAKAMLHGMLRTTAQYAYWRLRGYAKAKGYYYTENLKFFWRVWSQYRDLRKLSSAKLADLEGKRFVYFPLHVEPETALHGFSPEYFYQQALIAAVSRDLPAGVVFAVKEAYGSIGRRPANFYRQIADLKNVVLLDCWERGLDCAQKADAVVTICGTAGLEAVVAGTPVISFGHHNLYNFLPSVRVVHDEAKLKDYLREALFEPGIRACVRSEGRRLLQSIVDSSFDMGTYDYIDLKKFETEAVDAACESLVAGLEQNNSEISLKRETA